MFFNGFTLLLIIVSTVCGIVIGVQIEMAYQRSNGEECLCGVTIEEQMNRDGWKL